MTYNPTKKMMLGIFLLFWTACNALLGSAGFALCVHGHGTTLLTEVESSHCVDQKEHCHVEPEIVGSVTQCLDIDLEGELEDYVQGSYTIKASPSTVSDFASIWAVISTWNTLLTTIENGGLSQECVLRVCKTPILVSQTTVFRL